MYTVNSKLYCGSLWLDSKKIVMPILNLNEIS